MRLTLILLHQAVVPFPPPPTTEDAAAAATDTVGTSKQAAGLAYPTNYGVFVENRKSWDKQLLS